MTRYILSPRAQADLDSIWSDTPKRIAGQDRQFFVVAHADHLPDAATWAQTRAIPEKAGGTPRQFVYFMYDLGFHN